MAEFARGLISAYQAGTEERQAETKRNALSAYVPQALQGDKAAAGQVGAVDPGLGVQLMNHLQNLDEKTRQREIEDSDWLGSQVVGPDGKPVADPQTISRIQMLASARGMAQDKVSKITPENIPILIQGSQAARQYKRQIEQDALSRRVSEANIRQSDAATAASGRSNRGGDGFGPDDIDEDSLDYAATILRQTGRMPPMGQGKAGTAARREILRRAAAQAKAESGTTRGGAIGDLANAADYAGSRTGINALDRRSANLDAAAREVQAFSKNALAASAAVPRTSWLPVNQAIQYARTQTGSPEQRAFGQFNLSLANAYAVVANRGGQPTVASQQHALEQLATADGPEAYEAAVNAILTETQAAMESTAQSRGDILKRIRGEKVDHGAGGEKKADPLGIR